MNKDLKGEVQANKDQLAACNEQNYMKNELTKLIDIVEQMTIHFDFTLAIIASKSEEEVEEIKKKFASISKQYENVKSKENLSPYAAKAALGIFHDKMLLELKRVSKKCYIRVKKGTETKLVQKDNNLALIQIMRSRFEAGCQHYPMVLTFDQTDIFSLPKSAPVWQDIYKSAVFRQILTKEEVDESFKLLYFLSNLGHLIIKRLTESQHLPPYRGVYDLVKDIIYYGLQQSKAETQALVYLIKPDVETVFKAWNLIDHPWITPFTDRRLPLIGYDDLIYIPKLFPRITKESVLKEYEDGTINKIIPLSAEELRGPDLVSDKDNVLKELWTKRPGTIPVRILKPDHLDIPEAKVSTLKGFFHKAKQMIMSPCTRRARPVVANDNEEHAIIIHLHGGGFVAMTSASMRIYLSRWCKNLKMTCFSVDYSKAPKNPYPNALDDVWQSYLWITNYAETVLGIKNQKIIIAGDSSGGNLAIAVTLRIIKAGLKPPAGLLMVYPCLQLDLNYASPSSFQALDDPMLHISLLKLCISSYVGDMNGLEDPFISPVLASDEILEKMPPVRIITGSEDPMQDDNWRLLAKLRRLNKDVKMIVHQHLSHAFMAHQDLKNYKLYIQEACELIRELLGKTPNENEEN
jgi:hormone-sensitive lipase